ncbi:MAG: 50S ribosome-binding GTPase, partial [Gammaproteobacteria bacterium]|nr:50S ribosome-binding GTPase [Gammaproteobacteria bacterium]
MAIQWYPGHMHKAQKEMKQVIARMDVIIEVIDARIPYSSTNPVIAELSNFKGLVCPVIKLMNKADLADPEISALWQQHFELNQNTRALALIANQNFTSEKRKIIELIKKMVPTKATADKPVNAMIMGIPNVGKSTIINALAERKIAKVGNEPAVTQRQQRIDLEDNIILYDTPG